MKTLPAHLLAFALAGLCATGNVVLVALGHPAQENLWNLSYASLVGGAGLAPAPGTTIPPLTPAP